MQYKTLFFNIIAAFWGKFGQRCNQNQTTYFRDPQPFFELVFDPANVIHAVNYINDNLVSVSHSKETEYIDILPNTNVVLAAFTTSQARLHLYSFIEQLGDRCYYFDTGRFNVNDRSI